MPKGFRKQIKLTSQHVGVERRQELLDDIADGNGFLPQGVDIKDMDVTFVDFVKEKLKIEIDGEQVPVIFLTIQRYTDFTKIWKFVDEYKNIKMPFITVVRKPDIQKGTNQAGLANIPGHQHWSYYKVPTNDGARIGMDIYKIPQPTAVDITYEVRFFSNKMSDVNVIHNKVQREFNAIQSYIYPKGHPMPVTLPTVTDESNVEDFENRRFYIQAFEMLLAGYILDEEDFVVQPTINRAMVLSEIAVDPSDNQITGNQNTRTPVIRSQGSVIIRNSVGNLIVITDCNTSYVVGNTQIINSGATFSISVPATSGYTLENIINYDSDGSPVLTPAMVGFTATTCEPVTITNSGATYSVTTGAGTTLELPNILIHSTLSAFTDTIPSVENYTIADNIYTNSDGSTGNTSEYGSIIVCTPQVPCLDATVENSGSTYSVTVVSGGLLILPDIEVTDSDGFAYFQPSVTDVVCTPQVPCGDATVQNADASYQDVITAGGLLILPDIEVTDSDGSTYFQPSVTDVVCIPQVQALFIQFGFLIGDDQTGDLTIDADNAGTFTSTTDDGSSGDITFSINSGAFVTFVNPTVLGIGDTIAVNRTITTGLGFAKILGTYV